MDTDSGLSTPDSRRKQCPACKKQSETACEAYNRRAPRYSQYALSRQVCGNLARPVRRDVAHAHTGAEVMENVQPNPLLVRQPVIWAFDFEEATLAFAIVLGAQGKRRKRSRMRLINNMCEPHRSRDCCEELPLNTPDQPPVRHKTRSGSPPRR